MNRSSLIGHIVELHEMVRAHSQPADNTAKEFFRKRHYLGSHDRRYISEALYGILRNTLYLEAAVSSALQSMGEDSPKFRKASLAVYVAYSVKLLGEPPEAILPEVRGLWRSVLPLTDCEKFMSAVEGTDPLQIYHDQPARRVALQYSFPDEIVEEWLKRFGEHETEALCSALNKQAPTTVRVNTLKAERKQCLQSFVEEGVECEPTMHSPLGLTLKKRVNIQALQSFRNGYFEIQDEGSQLLGFLTEARPGTTVVDACAGGGGKTLHLASLMGNTGKLIAINIEQRHLREIGERANRAGALNISTLLTTQDALTIQALENQADVVFIDAPCSGVGTFRRNPATKLSFTRDFSERLAKTQRQVLASYSALVKPGGRLVYATCTLLQRENEEVVDSFLSEHPEFSIINANKVLERQGIRSVGEGRFLALFPNKTNTDGFFAAVMTKT